MDYEHSTLTIGDNTNIPWNGSNRKKTQRGVVLTFQSFDPVHSRSNLCWHVAWINRAGSTFITIFNQ